MLPFFVLCLVGTARDSVETPGRVFYLSLLFLNLLLLHYGSLFILVVVVAAFPSCMGGAFKLSRLPCRGIFEEAADRVAARSSKLRLRSVRFAALPSCAMVGFLNASECDCRFQRDGGPDAPSSEHPVGVWKTGLDFVALFL